MNKVDLIEAVALKAGLTRTQAAETVEATFSIIEDQLQSGKEVRLVGFGTFRVSKRAASDGLNPRTGEKIRIPERKQPKFTAGKQLKEAVNKD